MRGDFMSNKDEMIKQAIKEFLKDTKTMAVEFNAFPGQNIEEVPIEELVRFSLSMQTFWLSKLLKDGESINKNLITSLRLINEMSKSVIGVRQQITKDTKLQVNDPMKALQDSLKKSMKKEVK